MRIPKLCDVMANSLTLIAVRFTLPETLGNCRAFQLLRGDVCSGAGEVAAEMVDVDDMIGPCERAVKKTDRR
jgi:hypothetical protein